MPFLPCKARLRLVLKFPCYLGIAESIFVSMVMVNSWLLTNEGHGCQYNKCSNPKSNGFIFRLYKSVILWPHWDLLHPLKSF